MIMVGKEAEAKTQGKWKYDGFCVTTIQYKCSICGTHTLDRSKFCPNCGAYMKGKNNND